MSGQRQKSTSTAKQKDNPFRFDPNQMQAISDAGIYMSKYLAEANNEAFRFVHRRLNEDFSLPSKIATCYTPADVARTQMEFFQKMVTDYSEESQKFLELSISALKNGGESRNGRKRSTRTTEQ